MKKRQFYLVLNKRNKYTFGAFPRNKDGRAAAILYKKKLKIKHAELDFIVK